MGLFLRAGAAVTAMLAACVLLRPQRIFAAAARFLRTATRAQTSPYGNPLPSKVHVTLERQQLKPGRLIIIGDVHGCAQELRLLLAKLHYNSNNDNLVFAGDLVNKGPDSVGVLELYCSLHAYAVRGNHDDAALAQYNNHVHGRPVKEQFAWVRSLTSEQVRALGQMPFSISIPDYSTLVVHAGLVPHVPLQEQQLADLYKMRNLVPVAPKSAQAADAGSMAVASPASAVAEASTPGRAAAGTGMRQQPALRYTTVEKPKNGGGEAWASIWRGPAHVFFGHDAKRRLQLQPAATGLDTGCVYGGQLTAAVLPPLQQDAKAAGDGSMSVGAAAEAAGAQATCTVTSAGEQSSVHAPLQQAPGKSRLGALGSTSSWGSAVMNDCLVCAGSVGCEGMVEGGVQRAPTREELHVELVQVDAITVHEVPMAVATKLAAVG